MYNIFIRHHHIISDKDTSTKLISKRSGSKPQIKHHKHAMKKEKEKERKK